MTANLTLEALVDAIRGGLPAEELLRMVGPSDEEVQEAKARLDRLDALSPECEWDSMTPSPAAQRARERWDTIMRYQGGYERMYL